MGSGIGGGDRELPKHHLGSGGDDGENDVGSTEEVSVPDPEDTKPRLSTEEVSVPDPEDTKARL